MANRNAGEFCPLFRETLTGGKVDLPLPDSSIFYFGSSDDVGVQWDGTNLLISAAADNSLIEIGDSASTQKSFDLKWYGDGASGVDYLYADASANKIYSSGGVYVQIGESTTGVTTAGGTSMIYGYGAQKTNALTGTLRGLRGNAVVLIASANGTVEGIFGRGGNGTSTTAVDGVNLGVARGGSFLVAGVGLTGGPAVLTRACGVFSQLDIDAANLTVSDARGIYVNVQSGNASGNTLTACNLAYLEYESVVGTAPAINSAIRIAMVGGCAAASTIIDATSFKLAVTDTDKVCLMKFTDAAGTTKNMLYDTGTPALSFT
jgi:hypothetical protein